MCNESGFRARKPWRCAQRWAACFRYVLFSLSLLVNTPTAALGQQLVAGDAIGLRATRRWPLEQRKPQWTEATVVRVTPDTLWYQSGGHVSPISVEKSEIRRRTFRNHQRAGTVIGVVAGGAIGALAGHASYEPKTRVSGPPVSREAFTVESGFYGALIGGGLGHLLGKALGHWETVELDRITARDGNLAVSVRIRR